MIESRFFWLTVLVIISYTLYLLSPILTPFLLATLLAYLGDPLVDRLEKFQLSRLWAVIVVFLTFILGFMVIILFLIPEIDAQAQRLGQRIPDYINWIQTQLGTSFQQFDLDMEALNASHIKEFIQKHIGNLSTVVSGILGSLKGSANIFITVLTYVFLIPVVTFYLLRDWDSMIEKINTLIPNQYRSTIALLARRSDAVLGGFLRGQLLVMLGLGIIYAVGLSIVGLDIAIPIGLFSGLVSFVPYLGLIVGIVIAGVMALLQFQDWLHPLAVVIVFIFAQIIEGTVLTPKLIGERIGLHPVTVLFSVLAGGQLFGFMGVLLALPTAAIINVFLGYFKEHYLKSNVYLEINNNDE